MPVEPPFHTYREQLWPIYRGLALWEPNPGNLYDRVSIGDVGYISEGAFIRMFNVRLPWDDESNRRFGIPDRYDPLSFGDLSIRSDTFDEVDYYSRCVSRDENANNLQAASPEQADGVAYSCRGRGALLSLPHGGHREDAVQMKIFEKYIQDNVVSWFIWAQKNHLGVERMEDLILVSGCTLVTTWAAAVFTDHTLSAEISLASRTRSNGGASFVWSNVRGPIVHHNRRFDPQNLPTTPDQCVFIKGFRAKRVLFRIKPLRAAAEPLPDDPDNRRDGDIHVTPVPGDLKYRDPLIGVLDYIAEKCIEGAIAEDIIAIAHDDDLQFIEYMKPLTADEIEKHLHERNMPLLVENGAAILRVPINNTPSVSNEKQVASYEAAESNGESLPLVFHPALTDYYLKPEMTEYINHDHDPRTTFLLDFPPELLVRTLEYLSPKDIISCRRTCRRMYNICNDPYLRYLVQMERCGVSDDLRPGLCYSDRLRILERHEEAWAMLDFRNTVRVHVPFDSTDVHELRNGTLLLGTRMCATSGQPTVGYSYVSLPSLSVEQDQKLQWMECDIGIQILRGRLAVHEHDLIAALTARADDGGPSDRRMTLELRLLSFSTGQPHPLAEEPIIFITTKSLRLGHCNVCIEIVGDFLALLITFPWARNEHEDMFFLVRWETGEAYCLRSFGEWGEAFFSFLSQDTLVIPNLIQNTLEIFKIVIKSDDIPCLVPLCVLNLPPLTQRASIILFNCQAEPNPTGPGPLPVPAPSSRPFRDKAEDAIILFSVLIEGPVTRMFTFIVHRRALLDHIPATHRACAPFCTTPEPAPETVQVPWEAWGASATRWFEGGSSSMRWITTAAGQRAVMMEDVAPTPIIVRDFNPYAVRSARARAAAGGYLQQWCDWSEDLPNGNRMTLKVDESVIAAGSIFKDDVRSSLPYVEIVTQAEYGYDGVLIDEERILGLKTQTSQEDGFRYSSFDVHLLG